MGVMEQLKGSTLDSILGDFSKTQQRLEKFIEARKVKEEALREELAGVQNDVHRAGRVNDKLKDLLA